ncbi:MAG: lysine--tRNA ligase [Candidatus Sungbacteria bacterium]|nr:lysine--tRNA ligase [bacterium]MDZ4260591.1 lysine--tRNA ligase [Candidatus Sungbacteria bacterium]
MAIEEIRNERIKKRETLLVKGIDPYPSKTERSHEIGELIKKFSSAMKLKKGVAVAGRIMARREHGGSTFLDVEDGSGTIQCYLKRDVLGDDYDLFFDVADIGDVIQVMGKAFETHRKEKTIEVATWVMLTKSLRPLPEKWHGLQDVEERFRKRYLDLLMNSDVRKRFEKRSHIIRAVRAFFDREKFLEVETPMFHPIAGGALARPFQTHHYALDIDLYLRIAPELYLKQLLVGGYERVYELGKSFRNEGIDASHNPEFTSVEWYAAFWDEEMMMDCTERCMAFILKELGIKKDIEFDGKQISFAKKFSRFDFKEILQRYALIADYDRETRDSLATRARQLGVEASPHESKGKIADEIYKKICRPYLVQPTFIMNHPLDISPLAKKKTDDTVRRFQLVIGGLEMVNAFSELNDPIDQRERFEVQEKMSEGGQDETHPLDEAFIEALEYGMPPAAGAAIGIDRLVMFLTNTKNIREVVLFPTMRPKPETSS